MSINQKSPIIVLGNQRTSTTFLAHNFNQSSTISFGSEDGVIRLALIWFKTYLNHPELLRYSRISEFLDSLKLRKKDHHTRNFEILSKYFKRINESGELESLLNKKDCYNFIQNICCILYQKKKSSATLWGDKYPEYLFQIEDILEVFPEAKFIMMTRHPYSNIEALSRKLSPNGLGKIVRNLNDCVDQYNYWNSCWTNSSLFTNSEQALTIRYEDLMLDTWNTMTRINNFIKVDIFDNLRCEKFQKNIDKNKIYLNTTHKLYDQIEQMCKDNSNISKVCKAYNYEF